MANLRLIGLLTFVMLLAGCTVPNVQTLTQSIPANTSQVDTTPDGDATRNRSAGQRADLLSAFFGLDDDLPGTANLRICGDIGRTDGMPVIFSHEVDVETLQAADFRVVTASGQEGRVDCVTLTPANAGRRCCLAISAAPTPIHRPQSKSWATSCRWMGHSISRALTSL